MSDAAGTRIFTYNDRAELTAATTIHLIRTDWFVISITEKEVLDLYKAFANMPFSLPLGLLT